MVNIHSVLRATFLFGITLLFMSCSTEEDSEFKSQYIAYKALFIDGGRVVDTGNDEVSHSEGQGYGMLFAVAANDKDTFNALWHWTKSTLMRDDGLFSWRYRPCIDNSAACIDDPNNASDGEILIAWALLRANERWGVSNYLEDAKAIVGAVEQKLLITQSNSVVLLPGEYGFTSEQAGNNSLQLNLSYWVFPAITDLAKISATPARWEKLYNSGLALLSKMQFSSYKLPSDWVRFTPNNTDSDNKDIGTVSLDNVISPEFGFNAIRIPLQLSWSPQFRKNTQLAEELLAPYYAWWAVTPTPATINLLSEETAEYEMSKGMKSVQIAVNSLMKPEAAQKPKWPSIDRNMDYYSASLTLLSMLAVLDNAS